MSSAHLAIAVSLGTLALSASLVPGVRRLALRVDLMDHPGTAAHKSHVRATPYGGGAAIWLSVVVLAAIAALSRAHEPWETGLLLGCASVMFLIGLLDDWRALPALPRFLAQFATAAVLVGVAPHYRLPVGPTAVAAPLTIVWIMALTNSFNFLDNMDGLAAGLGTAACLILGSVAWTAGSAQTLVLDATLAGALLGFLVHNFPPARVFMGDAGGLFIGFTLGALSAGLSHDLAAPSSPRGVWAPLAPLMAFTVPLYDLATVTVIRLCAGTAPWIGDNNHISHRLVALGLSRRTAVMVLYAAALASGVPALLVQNVSCGRALLVLMLWAVSIALVGAADWKTGLRARRPRHGEGLT